MLAKQRNTVILIFVAFATIATARTHADRSWNAGNGNWSVATNWTPNGIPNVGDFVSIGDIGGVGDWEVLLDTNEIVGGLSLSNGRDLDTNGHRLLMSGDALINGTGTLLAIERGVLPLDFEADVVSVTNGALLRLDFGAIVEVDEVLSIGDTATLASTGTVRLMGNGAKALNLNGSIWTGSSLTIQQLGTGLMDLDGMGGDSSITVASEGVLTLEGTSLHDPFNGRLTSGRDTVINMNFANGWGLASSGEIRFSSGFLWNDYGNGHNLNGGDITIGGRVETADDNTDANINADVQLTTTSEVDLFFNSRLDFNGQTELLGGDYTVGQEARLRFTDDTIVHGGTFNTWGPTISDGGVYFSGETTWSGDVTISGYATQNGDASVTQISTITAEVFDMDGNVGGNTHWDISAPLTIQADAIDVANLGFDGSMDIGGALLSGLQMELTDPTETWVMQGTLDLSGNAAFYVDRLSGNPVRMNNLVNVTANTKVGITADTTFGTMNTVDFASAASELRMNGITEIEPGATFQGGGTLVNGPAGTMILQDGANVDVDVHNRGTLQIDSGIGQATVKRFVQLPTGRVEFDLASPFSADQLDATANVTLAGTLAIDPDAAYVDPSTPGDFDEFTLITSSLLSGEFDVVEYDGMALDWQFTGVTTYRSHEGDGLFRIVDYDNDDVSFTNYRAMLGDANGDGSVNGLDFTIWNDNKFMNGTDWTTGDFNGDGITNGLDFTLWNNNKFTSVGNFSLMAVPEPSGQLCAFGLLLVCLFRPRR